MPMRSASKTLELALALGVPLGSTPFQQVAERAARATPPAFDVVEATVAKMVEASRAHAHAQRVGAGGGGGGGGAVWEPPGPRVWAQLLSKFCEHDEARRGVALLEAMKALGISRAKIIFHLIPKEESLAQKEAAAHDREAAAGAANGANGTAAGAAGGAGAAPADDGALRDKSTNSVDDAIAALKGIADARRHVNRVSMYEWLTNSNGEKGGGPPNGYGHGGGYGRGKGDGGHGGKGDGRGKGKGKGDGGRSGGRGKGA